MERARRGQAATFGAAPLRAWNSAHMAPQPVRGSVIFPMNSSTNAVSGGQLRQPVLLFDQEQPGHAAGERGVDDAADLGASLVKLPGPVAQQRDDLAGGQRRDQRERGDEVGVILLRFRDQFPQPVAELGPAGMGGCTAGTQVYRRAGG